MRAKAGETTTAPDFEFTPGGVLRVQLVDEADKTALRIAARRKGTLSADRSEIDEFAWAAYTDHDGKVDNTDDIVEWDVTGTAERRLRPGRYKCFASVFGDDELTNEYVSSPGGDSTFFTCEIREGEITELKVPVRPATSEPSAKDLNLFAPAVPLPAPTP